MRPDELADAAKQTLRAEAASAVLQGAQVKESVTDALQKRTQTALLGGEEWRDSQQPDKDKDKEGLQAAQNESPEHTDHDHGAPMQLSGSPTKDEPPLRPSPKRSIDVDVGTRPNPAKRIKVDPPSQPAGRQFTSLKESLAVSSAHPLGSNEPPGKPSPRSSAGSAGLLNMLKSAPKQVAPPTPAATSKYTPLVTVHGSGNFTLTFGLGKTKETFTLRCTARVLDRRVQGLVDSTTIHGRSKVDDVDAFVRDKQGKKGYIIAVLAINVCAEDEPAYRRLCDDYSQSEPQRAGVCKADSEKVTSFNVVPPALKHRVALLRDVSLAELPDKENLLYGILLTKQQGPDNYVNASREEVEMLIKK